MNQRLVFVIIGVMILTFIGLITFSSIIFETKEPEIELANETLPTHWNFQDDFEITFKDESGIRDYRVRMMFNDEVLTDEKEVVLNKPKSVKIKLPKTSATLKNGTEIQYYIEVTDWSNAHFFSGNTARIKLNLIVDTQPPHIIPIAHSYRITRGGSAMVAFQVKDIALKDVFVSNGVDRFEMFKYLGDDIYVSIIAWPLKNKFFDAQIIAVDQAGNTRAQVVPLARNMNVTYYRSNIRLQESFLNGKLNELIEQIDKKHTRTFDDDIERFVFFNETIRQEDENRILSACSNLKSDKRFIDENFHAFVPLKGSKLVGNFGDHRTYFLNGDEVSKAVHLGIDVASVKNAPIIASNRGIVLLNSHLGLYGNTALVYHGLGVSSIYSHMSESNIEVGDEIQVGNEIGKTGATGWAFGDHLHFGILIQGHFVLLAEWLDSQWIKHNILDVLTKTQHYYTSQSQ